jgi:hypothetical protein
MVTKASIAALPFILFAFTLFAPNMEAKAPLTEKQALDLLTSRIQKDKLYDSWTTLSCLSIFIDTSLTDPDERDKYFDITIREKHDGKCPGDPLTAPLVDHFRVNRRNSAIQWYDPDLDLHPYKAVIEWQKKIRKQGQ